MSRWSLSNVGFSQECFKTPLAISFTYLALESYRFLQRVFYNRTLPAINVTLLPVDTSTRSCLFCSAFPGIPPYTNSDNNRPMAKTISIPLIYSWLTKVWMLCIIPPLQFCYHTPLRHVLLPLWKARLHRTPIVPKIFLPLLRACHHRTKQQSLGRCQ